MDDRIKSAFEIAMEKAAKLEKLSPEEVLRMKWVPEGERLAALYLRGDSDLSKMMKSIERSAFPYVLRGMISVLAANITLPRSEAALTANQRALDAFRLLCKDGKTLSAIAGRVTNVQEQYAGYGRQLLERSYNELKQRFTEQVQQQLKKQGIPASQVKVDIESMPEFQSQWRATASRIEQQYEQHLEEFRQQLKELVLSRPASF